MLSELCSTNVVVQPCERELSGQKTIELLNRTADLFDGVLREEKLFQEIRSSNCNEFSDKLIYTKTRFILNIRTLF